LASEKSPRTITRRERLKASTGTVFYAEFTYRRSADDGLASAIGRACGDPMEGYMADFVKLSDELKSARNLDIEVLTAAELDVVVGGGPFSGDSISDSSCTSQCHVDGNMETGTS
jgi:hypothetical protein